LTEEYRVLWAAFGAGGVGGEAAEVVVAGGAVVFSAAEVAADQARGGEEGEEEGGVEGGVEEEAGEEGVEGEGRVSRAGHEALWDWQAQPIVGTYPLLSCLERGD
jgi:hypothetical protein